LFQSFTNEKPTFVLLLISFFHLFFRHFFFKMFQV